MRVELYPAGLWVDPLQHWDSAMGTALQYFPHLALCKRPFHCQAVIVQKGLHEPCKGPISPPSPMAPLGP